MLNAVPATKTISGLQLGKKYFVINSVPKNEYALMLVFEQGS